MEIMELKIGLWQQNKKPSHFSVQEASYIPVDILLIE